MNIVKQYYAGLTAVIVFIIYLTTMASTVIHLDAGELAAVQSTLGIAHPTGYPLFTIVGFLFAKLLFPFSPIDALNLLAAIYCSLAVWIFAKITYLILSNIEKNKKKKKKKEKHVEIREDLKVIISITTGLAIGLTKTFWFQSTSVEVYSLHLFLMSLILYSTLNAFYSGLKKYWFHTAVFLALGFSNHMTTILLIPGIAYLFFKQNGIKKESFRLIIKMLLVFFPILILIYSYLPIRAMQNPHLNWGNPVDWERFIRHVSGAQYQVWIFSSIEAAKKQLIYFIESLPLEFGYIGLIISLIGVPLLFKFSKTIAVFLIINFLAAVTYSINYDIADIDSYFLLAFISLAIFTSAFFIYISKFSKDQVGWIILLVPLTMAFVNYNNVNKSNNYVFEDYTKAVLDEADENGIIFSYLWDYFISPSYYFQYVENYRRDVAVIDKELLRRSWYFNQLEKNIPEVMKGVEPQSAAFLKALQPFERDEPFNANYIEQKYRELMTALISANINERSFYITPELVQNEMQSGQFQIPAGYTLVPMKYFFKVVKSDEGYIEADFTGNNIRFTNNPDYYENNIKNFLSVMMVYRIMYELQHNYVDKAKKLYNTVRMENPNYRLPPSIINKFEN